MPNKKPIETINELPIFAIRPNKEQARKEFSEDALKDLARSIANNGVIVPIIVKPIGNEKYEIVAGERRWRASILAKQETIPAIIRDEDSLTTDVQSLLENVQRDDLNPIEEAHGYRALQDKYDLSQQDVANYIGKSRSQIANSLRLLNLDERVQKLLQADKISTGHAKVILGIVDNDLQYKLATMVIENNLSVRETEDLIKDIKHDKPDKKDSEDSNLDNKVEKERERIETDLKRKLATKVKFSLNKDNSGYIKIDFSDLENLERILDQLM